MVDVPLARSTSRALAPSFTSVSTIPNHEIPAPARALSRMLVPGRRATVGDDFYAPMLLSGDAGSFNVSMDDYTGQDWEPEPFTLWARKVSPAIGVLRLQPGPLAPPMPDLNIEINQGGDDVEETVFIASYEGLTGIIPDIDVNPETRIRFFTGTPGTIANVAWSFQRPEDVLALDLLTPSLPQSPGVLLVNVLGAPEGSTVRFTISGVPGSTDILVGPSGTIIGGAVAVPRGIPAGSHILTAANLTSGDYAERVFTVLARPEYPEPIPPDAPPVAIAQTGRRKWAFQDPMPGGLGEYLFETNPDSMSDPFPERYVTNEHTTSYAGQWILWEGAARAVEWRFAGYVTSQSAFEAMQDDWAKCKRRIHVHDHHNRAFLSRIKAVSLTPERRPGMPYRHRFEVRADVFGWVQL